MTFEQAVNIAQAQREATIHRAIAEARSKPGDEVARGACQEAILLADQEFAQALAEARESADTLSSIYERKVQRNRNRKRRVH